MADAPPGGSLKRPFWMHHLVEYILGISLVASGTQSPTPLVPSVLGAGVLVYAASTRSPIAAFRLIPRRVHRLGDPVVVAVVMAGALQPWLEVDLGTRFIVGAVAMVHLVVWWQSSYAERQPRSTRPSSSPDGPDTATEVGRRLGRLVGSGITAARRSRGR